MSKISTPIKFGFLLGCVVTTLLIGLGHVILPLIGFAVVVGIGFFALNMFDDPDAANAKLNEVLDSIKPETEFAKEPEQQADNVSEFKPQVVESPTPYVDPRPGAWERYKAKHGLPMEARDIDHAIELGYEGPNANR